MPYDHEILAPGNAINLLLNRGELEYTLHRVNLHTAPESSKVSITLSNISSNTKEQLLDWINLIWETGKNSEQYQHRAKTKVHFPATGQSL